MENLYKATRKGLKSETGMVLVVVMLFLLIISLLAINLLNASWLETKMSGYYQNKMQAFYEAEIDLKKHEQEIRIGEETDNAKITGTDYACGVIFYRVTASAASSTLQSTYAVFTNMSHCATDIKPGRQSFLVVR